jgi:hypothetical protein
LDASWRNIENELPEQGGKRYRQEEEGDLVGVIVTAILQAEILQILSMTG